MSWPSSQDYNEAIQTPNICFSDRDLKSGQVTVNALGLPIPRSGNFADVYQIQDPAGRFWAVKCFTRKVSGLQDRYAKIDTLLNQIRLPFFVGFQYLTEGIRVGKQWYPLLKMQWVEGFQLNEFVRDHVHKPNVLHALLQMWGKLTRRLREANIAHADLQHGNVLLVPGHAASKLELKLIDYDGMWIPSLAKQHSGEVGHPNYQHPQRLVDRVYNGEVDRFPHLVMATSLRATLIGGESLWKQFDNGDNLLFKENDLKNPASSRLFQTLWRLNDPILKTLVGRLALATQQPLAKTPWLDELLLEAKGPRLTNREEKQVAQLLGVSQEIAPIRVSASPVVLEEYNVFASLLDDDSETHKILASSTISTSTKNRLLFWIGSGLCVIALLIAGLVLLNKQTRTETEPENTSEIAQENSTTPKEDSDFSSKEEPIPKVEKSVTQNDSIPPKEEPEQALGEKATANPFTPMPPHHWSEPNYGTSKGIVFSEDGKRIFLLSIGSKSTIDSVWLDRSQPKTSLPDNPIFRTPYGILGGPKNIVLVTKTTKQDQEVVGFDMETKEQQWTIPLQTMVANLYAIHPTRKKILLLHRDRKRLYEHSLETGKWIRTLSIPIPDATISSFNYSSDGEKLVLTTAKGRQILIFPISNPSELTRIPHPSWGLTKTIFSPDNQMVLTWGNHETMFLHDVQTGEAKFTLAGHFGIIDGVFFTKDSKYIYSAARDQTLRVWETATGRCVQIFGVQAIGSTLTLCENGNSIALSVVDKRKEVRIYNLPTSWEPLPEISHVLPPENGAGLVYRSQKKYLNSIREMKLAGDQQTVWMYAVPLEFGSLPFDKPQTELRTWSSELDPNTITAFAFGPDYILFALGSDRRELGEKQRIQVWDWSEKRLLRTLSVGINWDSPIRHFHATPDGKYLIVANPSEPIQIWDWRTDQSVAEYQNPVPNFSFMIGHPKTAQMLVCSSEQGVLCDPIQQKTLTTFDEVKNPISAAFSPDGEVLALAQNHPKPFQLYSTTTGKPIAHFPFIRGIAKQFGFYTNGTFWLQDSSKNVYLMDPKTQEVLARFQPDYFFQAALAAPDGKSIIASDNSGLWDIWEWGAKDRVARLPASVSTSKQQPNAPKKDNKLVTRNSDPSGESQPVFEAPRLGSLADLFFSEDSSRLIAVTEDGRVRTWDTNGFHETNSFPTEKKVNGVHVTKDQLLFLNGDHKVRAWNWRDGQIEKEYPTDQNNPNTRSRFAANEDGSSMVIFGSKVMRSWDLPEGKERFSRSTTLFDYPTKLTYLPDGKRAVLISTSEKMFLWDMVEGKQIREFATTKGPQNLATSPDGKQVATTSTDGKISLWNIETGALQSTLPINLSTKTIFDLCFLNDKQVAGAATDLGIYVWNLESQKQQKLAATTEAVNYLKASRNGKWLVAGSKNGKLWVWALSEE